MPINLLKKYPELLEIDHLDEKQRMKSLKSIFDRDIGENTNFKFRNKQIHPTTQDGKDPLDILFHHLISESEENDDEKKTRKRFYDRDRSVRLHWIRHHVEEKFPVNLEVFSFTDRINRKNVTRTYIFDKTQKYVIILEPQRNGESYYLLTAYYLNKPYGLKQITKKFKNRHDHIS